VEDDRVAPYSRGTVGTATVEEAPLCALRPQKPPLRVARPRRRPEVSVCIVNWNCRAHLRACLRSLRSALQGVRLEIIVVDNGSTDGAPEMVERLFPHVLLLRNNDNLGFARANNQAAAKARGRYLFFLNNDTIVPPGSLRRLLDYARAHPEVGLIGPALRDGHGRTQVSIRRRPTLAVLFHRLLLIRWTGLLRRTYRRYRSREGDFRTTHPVEVLMGAALFVSRRAFRACGAWDEDYTFGGEDIDLCTRVARRHAVVYHPDVAILHHGRVSSRRNIGYAYANTVIGITRYLRKTGTSRAALFLYKAALTLDVPLQWLCQAGQYWWRRLRGPSEKATQSLRVLHGIGYFIRHGLGPFWKA
jgi:N-acetylglucosaminyl-diphospho-decaprenol L-rhamnosyltransferase